MEAEQLSGIESTAPAQGDTVATAADAGSGSWADHLPADLRDSPVVQGFVGHDVSEIVKAHVDLQGKAIVPPGEDATPEQRQAFAERMRQVLGVPETPAGYKVDVGVEIPGDDPVLGSFLAASHKVGLSNDQAQVVAAEVVKAIHEHGEAVKLVNKEALQKTWGNAFSENVALAIKGMEGAANDAGLGPEEKAYLQTAIPGNTALARVFLLIGQMYAEDRVGRGGAPGAKMERTQGGLPQLDFPSMRK